MAEEPPGTRPLPPVEVSELWAPLILGRATLVSGGPSGSVGTLMGFLCGEALRGYH